jgi:DivIVA domain-containing protein
VLAVVAAVGAVAAGLVRGGLAEPESSVPEAGLPAGPLDVADVSAVRFSIGLRGYRMDEVDDVLDRLAAELAARDAEIARLRGA